MIIDVRNYGLLIELPDVLDDGLVHVSLLTDDFYSFQAPQRRLPRPTIATTFFHRRRVAGLCLAGRFIQATGRFRSGGPTQENQSSDEVAEFIRNLVRNSLNQMAFELKLCFSFVQSGCAKSPPVDMDNIIEANQVQIERKHFHVELRENDRGKFLRITEEAHGRRNTIIVPSTGG